MSAEQQEFEKLSRLLKLKKYEQPHPRYFNDFSSQVIRRIQAGETPSRKLNWIERMWDAFAAKPAYTGIAAAGVCAMLVGITLYSDQGVSNVAKDQSPLIPPTVAVLEGSLTPHITLFPGLTNSVAPGQSTAIPPGMSLFDNIPMGQQLNVERVSWPGSGK